MPLAVMGITLVLTMVIPLQYAVLVGVGISVIVFIAGQSSRLVTKRLVLHPDGSVERAEPPAEVGANEVIVLQPLGAVFFATADALNAELPTVTAESRNSVVILRFSGADDVGSTVIEVLRVYADELSAADCRLAVVTESDILIRQLRHTEAADLIGSERIYKTTAFVGAATRQAHDDATTWIENRRSRPNDQPDPEARHDNQ
jgi:SulP family sulfate permease